MTGTLRERRKQMLRDEIFHAAQELVLEKGYASMAMDELAARVGISKPTLYSHFPTKEALVVEAITRELQALLELFDAHEGGTPLERLRFLLGEVLQRQLHAEMVGVGGGPELFRLMCENAQTLSTLQRIDRAIIELVRAGIAGGEIDPALDTASVVRAFYGLSAALPKSRLSAVDNADPARLAEEIARIFVRGVQAG